MKKNNDKKSEKDQTLVKGTDRYVSFLLSHGIRPTRQRLGLSPFLFDGKHRHVTAEQLMVAAKKREVKISLATIYNSLHEFVKKGVLKEVYFDDSCHYFDTNLENHSHFFDEKTCRLWDIASDKVSVVLSQEPPKGMEIDHVRLAVNLRKKG